MRTWNEAGTCQWDLYGDRVIIHGDEVVLTMADLRAMALALGEANDELPARHEPKVPTVDVGVGETLPAGEVVPTKAVGQLPRRNVTAESLARFRPWWRA